MWSGNVRSSRKYAGKERGPWTLQLRAALKPCNHSRQNLVFTLVRKDEVVVDQSIFVGNGGFGRSTLSTMSMGKLVTRLCLFVHFVQIAVC